MRRCTTTLWVVGTSLSEHISDVLYQLEENEPDDDGYNNGNPSSEWLKEYLMDNPPEYGCLNVYEALVETLTKE